MRLRHLLSVLLLLILPTGLCSPEDASGAVPPDDSKDSQASRERMVDIQIRARGVKDPRVLAAMSRVERHRFVPERWRASAYGDHPLPIAEGQTISQPYIVALMTELLELRGGERVLEVGTGSGYQAAVLAELAKEVFTIEIIEPLAASARKRLDDLGYRNIRVKAGDGYLGWPEAAPFDAVIVTAAPDHVPQPLIDQLKEGGRMVIPVGTTFQELKRIVKRSGGIETRDVIPVRFVPFTGEGMRQRK
jgi:protein-L-isoaspartate(D-aspartate) O-methyltransferase